MQNMSLCVIRGHHANRIMMAARALTVSVQHMLLTETRQGFYESKKAKHVFPFMTQNMFSPSRPFIQACNLGNKQCLNQGITQRILATMKW
jgi:hypothetical protein